MHTTHLPCARQSTQHTCQVRGSAHNAPARCAALHTTHLPGARDRRRGSSNRKRTAGGDLRTHCVGVPATVWCAPDSTPGQAAPPGRSVYGTAPPGWPAAACWTLTLTRAAAAPPPPPPAPALPSVSCPACQAPASPPARTLSAALESALGWHSDMLIHGCNLHWKPWSKLRLLLVSFTVPDQ